MFAFAYEPLQRTLFDHSLLSVKIKWVSLDVDGHKIIKVCNPLLYVRLYTISALLSQLLHMNWGNDTNSADDESLTNWANFNNLTLLYNPKDAASFRSGR